MHTVAEEKQRPAATSDSSNAWTAASEPSTGSCESSVDLPAQLLCGSKLGRHAASALAALTYASCNSLTFALTSVTKLLQSRVFVASSSSAFRLIRRLFASSIRGSNFSSTSWHITRLGPSSALDAPRPFPCDACDDSITFKASVMVSSRRSSAARIASCASFKSCSIHDASFGFFSNASARSISISAVAIFFSTSPASSRAFICSSTAARTFLHSANCFSSASSCCLHGSHTALETTRNASMAFPLACICFSRTCRSCFFSRSFTALIAASASLTDLSDWLSKASAVVLSSMEELLMSSDMTSNCCTAKSAGSRLSLTS
mmetsp:Transcript_32060/g.73225  ORF Transcript_32060/g.73225 Transcript_32060/m.73225 type:complete len:320 (+) Transcript_32060:744-1703(+)